jgi:hypothetical protein
MRVIVFVKASKESEAGEMPTAELLAQMGKYNEELANAGIMVAGEGLHPSSKGKRVRFSGPKPTVIDGPFSETKELVAGYWLWKVKSMDEAVAWLKKAPFQDTEVEIRPLFETDDFGDAMTPELREQEDRIRTKIEGKQ